MMVSELQKYDILLMYRNKYSLNCSTQWKQYPLQLLSFRFLAAFGSFTGKQAPAS